MRTNKLTLQEKWDILQELIDYTPITEIEKKYKISNVTIWRLNKRYKNGKIDMYKCKKCGKITKFDKSWKERTPYMYDDMCFECLDESNRKYFDEQDKWLNEGTEEEKDEKLCQMYMENGFLDKKEDWVDFKKWLDRQ
jgi:hypothetical protein